ncbi:MAG: CoB--CoM heterodisulfide reductase iron-sulfur subunit A family protein, partial [Candidatus Lokiarchaeota archaeon]
MVKAEHYMFMCSKPGVQMVKDSIEELGVNRTVVASCSKNQHGRTFANAIHEMGLNKHRHQQVNIREFDSWVHQKEKEKATNKAMRLIGAGVNRARKLEDVETRRIPTTKAALVIGAGIAGLRASHDLAELGIPVYLVERLSTIGGHMTQLNKTFPTLECPQCSISPLTNGVANHPLIELYTNANIKAIEGSMMEPETKRFKVGSIVVAAGYDEYDPSEIEPYHYKQEGYEDVITQLQLERMLAPGSLTNSQVLRPSDARIPKNVVMIQCVGSRNDQVGNQYCTGVCCKFAVKNARIIKEMYPNTNVTICYIDVRTPGLNFEELYKSAQEVGVRFIRGRPSEIIKDPVSGALSVSVEDTLSQTPLRLKADMVVLSAAMVPPEGIGPLGSKLQVLRSKEGFLKEFHIKMNPTLSSKGGIFLAGAIQ